MRNARYIVPSDDVPHEAAVQDASLIEGKFLAVQMMINIFPASGAQIIENDNVIVPLHESVYDIASDKSRASCYEY
jgi:hypothetical protein